MPHASRLSAAQIAHALGGRRSGKDFIVRCPAHDDQTPSLSIADSADGKVLVHCHAGCSQEAVIAALTDRGLWHQQRFLGRPMARRTRRDVSASSSNESAMRRRALQIWRETHAAEGTLVETYLRSRGITLSPPAAIRFLERLNHRPSKSTWPAMVALITDSRTNEPIGIHRTFLALDGSGKPPIEPSKMMLGSAKGGVIRLAEAREHLMVGEGVETCLSVLQACGIPSWAALSASGLKALNLPPGITSLTILADGDINGERAAQAAAQRLRLTVRTVRIVRAPTGLDFNDLLTADHATEKEDDR